MSIQELFTASAWLSARSSAKRRAGINGIPAGTGRPANRRRDWHHARHDRHGGTRTRGGRRRPYVADSPGRARIPNERTCPDRRKPRERPRSAVRRRRLLAPRHSIFQTPARSWTDFAAIAIRFASGETAITPKTTGRNLLPTFKETSGTADASARLRNEGKAHHRLWAKVLNDLSISREPCTRALRHRRRPPPSANAKLTGERTFHDLWIP
jgi:hypothetical protein